MGSWNLPRPGARLTGGKRRGKPIRFAARVSVRTDECVPIHGFPLDPRRVEPSFAQHRAKLGEKPAVGLAGGVRKRRTHRRAQTVGGGEAVNGVAWLAYVAPMGGKTFERSGHVEPGVLLSGNAQCLGVSRPGRTRVSFRALDVPKCQQNLGIERLGRGPLKDGASRGEVTPPKGILAFVKRDGGEARPYVQFRENPVGFGAVVGGGLVKPQLG